MEISVGNYLVYVVREGEDGTITFAIEWGASIGWSKCEKESATWYESEKPFDSKDHEGLLKHFGLSNWKDEFPMDKMLAMSPAALIAARRAKEEIPYYLEKKGPFAEEDHDELLKLFGLSDWKDEFPMDKVLAMTSVELIAARKEKEEMPHYPEKHEAFRNGDTTRPKAEDFS